MSSFLQKISILLGFLCVLNNFEGTTALICYQCNSEYDPRCGDPFDDYSLGLVNCTLKRRTEHLQSMEPTLCRKTTQKIYGQIRVVRGCGYVTDERDNGECLKRSGTHDVQALYCACTKDLCNGATNTKSMLMIGNINKNNYFMNALPLAFTILLIIFSCNNYNQIVSL